MSTRTPRRATTSDLASAGPVAARAGGVGNGWRAAGSGLGWGEGGDPASALAEGDLDTGSTAPGGGATGANGGAAGGPATPLTIDVQNAMAAAAGGSTTRTRVGIGEVTYLTPSRTGGTWSATGGTGTGSANSGWDWTAPAAAGSVTVTYTLGTETATQAFTVVAPATVSGTGTGDIGHAAGTHGAGLTLDLVIGPTDVSFTNLGWKELQGPITASGIFQGARAMPIRHNPNFSPMGATNDIQDTADHEGFPRPWGPGLMHYEINQLYRVGTSGAGTQFATVVQEHEMFGDDGTSQTRKAGASSGRRTP